jgi:hypothetical protein
MDEAIPRPLWDLSDYLAQERDYLFFADDIPHTPSHHISKHLVGTGVPQVLNDATCDREWWFIESKEAAPRSQLSEWRNL